jgi:heptosyltransferase-2
MKILIIGPSWVGDMVMAQSLFISLKQIVPDVEIHVLAPGWCKALLDHMPQISRAIEMTIGHGELAIGRRRVLASSLKQENYDQAIVLPNSFKSALIPWFAGIPVRTGWRGEARSWLLNDCRVLDKQAHPLMVERFIALAYPDGTALPSELPRPELEVKSDSLVSLLNTLTLDTQKPVLILCPGAEFGEAKKWPASGYAAVASHWLSQAGQVWIMGSANDSKDAGKIINALPEPDPEHCIDLTGKTTLGEAIDLMSCATRVVSNDSGLMHIAAALKRPQVVIYGSTSPTFTPPLADKVQIVSLELECSPCFKRVCPLGHTNCLKLLEPDQVIRSLHELDSP